MLEKVGFILLLFLICSCQSVPKTPPTQSPPPVPTLTSTPVPEPTTAPAHTAVSTSSAMPTQTAVPTEAPETAYPPQVEAWVQAQAVAFETAAPGQGCDDIAPLLDAIGEARVVALGEATHGTKEFFTMKHRLAECLVLEKGFTHFSIEANYPEANRVNDYIQQGEGTASQVVQGMLFWTWNTDEVVEMVEWMHAYNQSAAVNNRITFSGFDMQSFELALTDLDHFFEALDAPIGAEIGTNLACIKRYQPLRLYFVLSTVTQQQCREGIETAVQMMAENRTKLIELSSEEAVVDANQLLRIVQQAEWFAANRTSVNIRDEAMAENVLWLLERFPEEKFILWAHNFHIQKVGVEIEPGLYKIGEEEIAETQLIPMGEILGEQLGEDYVAVGFSFMDGAFNAISSGSHGNLGPFDVLPPLPDSYEPLLAEVTAAQYYLDLRQVPLAETAVIEWFSMPHWLRSIGAQYPPQQPEQAGLYLVLPEAFHIVIHFDQTTPSVLRPFN